MVKNTPESEEQFASVNLIHFLIKWLKPIAIVTIAAFIISAIISFILPVQYKSNVVLFPAQSSSVSKSVLSQNNGGKGDLMQFGEEEEAEQLLQMLKSDEIRDQIVARYDLMKHYKIDIESPYKNTELKEEYEENTNFERTKFGSVLIEVYDESPDTAAMIANDISRFLDSTKTRMQRARAKEGLKIVEREYNNLKKSIKIMEDSMTYLRKKGVHDYTSQVEVFNQQQAIAILEGNTRAYKQIQQKLDTLALYGSAYSSLNGKIEAEILQMAEIKAKYAEALADANASIPQTFIVDRAVKADKKSKPVRWLVVALSTAMAFIFSIVAVIVIENIRSYQKPTKA